MDVGEKNMELNEVICCMDDLFHDFLLSGPELFYEKHKAQFIVGQYWL